MESAIEIDNSTQLFVDDFLIDEMRDVVKRLNRPRKHPANPVMVADKPWEGHGVIAYGSIIPDPETGKFRLWYRGWRMDKGKEQVKSPVCYAESIDGIQWEKPIFSGLKEGEDGTNVVWELPHDCFAVDLDPDDEHRPYKLLASAFEWRNGLSSAWSPDGFQWNLIEKYAVEGLGDRCSYFYDRSRKKHIAWSRKWSLIPLRVIVQVESDDFENWGEPLLAIQPDRHDRHDVQLYGGVAFNYGSVYLGYLEIFWVDSRRLDTQLIWSRDGRKWERAGRRETFIDTGCHGDFDAYWAFPTTNPPLKVGGELLIHYTGRADQHAPPKPVPPGMRASLGLVTLRVDGFVSVDATGVEGTLTTKPIKFSQGESLSLNACPMVNVSGFEKMRLSVEILDGAGNPIPGYSREDAVEISGDSLEHHFRWRHKENVAELRDRPIRLKFYMFNTRLYSFQIV